MHELLNIDGMSMVDDGSRFVVRVPAGIVAVISFIAPFHEYDDAERYMRHWAGRRVSDG